MKKNNDGYVLPFVLVVMIVLCIISTSLMTAALRNLQMQQKFTERMVDKYAAQGEIEKVIACLSQEGTFDKSGTEDADKQINKWITDTLIPEWIDEKTEGNTVTAELKSLTTVAKTVAGAAEDAEGTDPAEGTEESEGTQTGTSEGTYTGTLLLEIQRGTTTIACDLTISGNYKEVPPTAPSTIVTYKIEPKEPVYQSYVISHTTEGGGS